MRRFVVPIAVLFLASLAPVSGQGATPSIVLASGLVVDRAGSITDVPGEVISGRRSIKGTQNGDASFSTYLRTVPESIPFAPGRAYIVTFRYTIIEPGDRGFEVLFFSQAAAARGSFLPGRNLNGPAGSTGGATLTNTLTKGGDYSLRGTVVGRGTIVVDEIKITTEEGNLPVAIEDAEGTAPRFQLAQAYLPPVRAGQPVSIPLSVTGGRAPCGWSG